LNNIVGPANGRQIAITSFGRLPAFNGQEGQAGAGRIDNRK